MVYVTNRGLLRKFVDSTFDLITEKKHWWFKEGRSVSLSPNTTEVKEWCVSKSDDFRPKN